MGLRACARCDPHDPWEREREREREREGERERASDGERGREGARGGERDRERERARESEGERERGERERTRGRDMGSRPIANKYHEGKVKRTLKRKVNVLEVAENEVSEATMSWRDCCTPPPVLAAPAYVWQ